MVDEVRGDRLVARRDARVTRAVADMGAQHNMDAEWALWKRLAYARQNKDLL
jgi:hypothetical protein